MTENQQWRIQQLEKSIEKLDAKVRTMELEREKILGMSTAGKWMIKGIVALAGYGGLKLILGAFHWLSLPMK